MAVADPIAHPSFPRGRVTPLRFKSLHDRDTPKRRERDGRFDSQHHRRRKHRHRRTEQGAPRHQDGQREDDGPSQELNTNTAFRESLFDAMADDEGADYWESVYGQPIHTFAPGNSGPNGELERMSEEDYVEFVRAEMWKKTNAGLLEERERRAKAKKAAEDVEKIRQRMSREDDDFRERFDHSIRKGKEREERKKEQDVWCQYQKAWQLIEHGTRGGSLANVPWPTFSGSDQDLRKDVVHRFIQHGAGFDRNGDHGMEDILKVERRRWHPDKFQQRAQGDLDDTVLKKATAVFQIMDDLWNKYKSP